MKIIKISALNYFFSAIFFDIISNNHIAIVITPKIIKHIFSFSEIQLDLS
jgi:hypothetical protein